MKPTNQQRLYSFFFVCFFIVQIHKAYSEGIFRVYPYLQNPDTTTISILWFTNNNSPGLVQYFVGDTWITVPSFPEEATSLNFSEWEIQNFPGSTLEQNPYKHVVQLSDLSPETKYTYRVIQEQDTFSASFKTAPKLNTSIRFIVYSDCETEPESTGKYADWDTNDGDESRVYLIDQTTGYSNNIEVIKSRNPDIVLVAGDLVETGGEQRDWEEFWMHNSDSIDANSLGGSVPILAALGNHEYYSGAGLSHYNQPGSETAVNKYLTYFEYPDNGADSEPQIGRYYSKQYGPVTFIILDVCNNGSNKGEGDTNFYLLGNEDENGGYSPGFSAGTSQYEWLENELALAQGNSYFTFVMLHHVPYSVGPHGLPPGETTGYDKQSGQPVRELTPLFLQYGVDAIFAGHDEIWERSEISGEEVLPDSTKIDYIMQVFDLGIGGDGLRAPYEGANNPYQEFLAHDDAPEVWQDTILLEGGKHYGHLEVDVFEEGDTWKAVLTPVYVLPVRDEQGIYSNYERKEYNDVVVIKKNSPVNLQWVNFIQLAAHYEDDGILVEWNVIANVEHYAFEIQRKSDSEWDSVMYIDGDGLADSKWFRWKDTSAVAKLRDGSAVYRIKQTNVDGEAFYSEEFSVQSYPVSNPVNPDFTELTCSPNPFETRINLQLNLHTPSFITLKLYTVQGKLIQIKDLGYFSKGEIEYAWDTAELPLKNNTLYFLLVEINSEMKESYKLVYQPN